MFPDSRFRDECPNEHLFRSLPHARRITETWRIDENIHTTRTILNGLA
jgi:putative transposase